MSRRLSAFLLSTLVLLAVLPLLASPLVHLRSELLGRPHGDAYGTLWFYWYVSEHLLSGEGLTRTDLLFFPFGKDIYLHTGSNVLDAIAAAPVRWLLGPVLGYNVFVLLGLLLNGFAGWAFTREFTRSPLAITVGALLMALHPFVLSELLDGRPTQAILLLPILFLRQLWRTGVRPGWRDPLLAGLLLAGAGLQYWFYALFGGMLALAHGLCRVAVPPAEAGSRWAVLGRHALIAAVSLLAVSPFAGPLLLNSFGVGADVPGLLAVDHWSWLASPTVTTQDVVVGLQTWQPLRLAEGLMMEFPAKASTFRASFRLTPLLVPVMLVVVVARPGRLHRGPLLAMLAVATVISVGPLLVVGSRGLPNMPYVWLAKAFGPIQRLWWPCRSYAFIAALTAVAAAVGVATLQQRRPWLGWLAATLLVGDLLVTTRGLGGLPFPTWSAAIPRGYSCLTSGPPGAIIELPYDWTQAHLYYQSFHQRPVLGGMIEDNPTFTPVETTRLLEQNSWLARLRALADRQTELPAWTVADRDAVGELGFRYLVVQKDALAVADPTAYRAAAQRLQLRQLAADFQPLAGMPVYDDARISIYAPWGGPAPCDPSSMDTDRQTLGEPAKDPMSRTPTADDLVFRLTGGPDPSDTEGAGSGGLRGGEGSEPAETHRSATP